ncbi:glycosyltransferase family 2 protein [Devosia sp. A449]
MPPVKKSTVAVLLATYNGDKFLDEQLASIQNQTHPDIDIWVSDDGSTDATKDILAQWREKWTKGRFNVQPGPRRGFAANFGHLSLAVEGTYAAYYFADQDDIWLNGKISRSLDAMRGMESTPVLYGARTRLVDENAHPIGLSPLFLRPKTFKNALVQSMAGGNTMALNPPAFALFAESARRISFVTHDWWAYMLITGAGGTAVYDPEPSLLYRQHAANAVGKNSGMVATFRRLRGVIRGQFRNWADANIAALEACDDMLSPGPRVTLVKWKQAHEARPPFGLRALMRSGVYRQNVRGNITLYLAALMGWL